MRRWCFLLIAPVLLAQDRAPGNDSIRADELKSDLYFLASDEMRGRLTGTPENRVAGEYVESRLKRLGLKPVDKDGSYRQQYDLVIAGIGRENRLEVSRGESSALTGTVLGDFYPLRSSATGRARGEVAYVGFGIRAPELNWDDYRGDVRGKIVLAFDGEPGAQDPKSPFDGVVTSEHSNELRKASVAQQQGAVALLLVSRRSDRGRVGFPAAARTYWPEKSPRIERFALAEWVDKIHIPVAQISPAIAEMLLGGGDLIAKSREAEKGSAGPQNLPGVRVDLQTSVERKVIPDYGVVAWIEGSDARLKDECVIVSAHFDHNGADGDQVFNGADDNGSGTVGLLEIAEAYVLAARDGRRPRRSVIFAAWNSEERGLLGAWAWVEHPMWPLDKTVAVLNMDMIGRSEEVPEGGGRRFNGLKQQTAASNASSVNLLGWSYSADLIAATRRANRFAELKLLERYDNNRSQLLRRSDHWPFLQHGVPALWFHTGLHPDYHTVYDRPEKIDYGKMERIARLVHQLSWELANADSRPAIVKKRSIPPEE